MNNVQRASAFYVKAIGDGKPRDAINAYVGATYIQHNPKVPTGAAAFAETFEAFATRNPDRDVRVWRGFEDGPLVILHVLQDLGGELWATMDVFRFQGDRIVEHWDNLAGVTSADVMSGPTMDGGDSEATRVLVQAFADRVVAGTAETEAAHCLPGVTDLNAWLAKANYSTCHLVAAGGGLGLAIFEGHRAETHESLWLLLHVADGSIDHIWGLAEGVLPPHEQAHDNGKFGF